MEDNLLRQENVEETSDKPLEDLDKILQDSRPSFETSDLPKFAISDGVHQFQNDDSTTYITFKSGQKNGLSQIFERDRLTMEMTFMNDLLNGPFKYYFPNKTVQLMMQYKDGKLHGDFIQFHPNGEVQMKTIYVNGLQEGLSQTFNAQKVLIQDMTYKAGLLEGPMNTYFDGQLIGRTYYKEGVEVTPKA
jgi:antitoxin component YwqK of YwqJK toxin-antitoxin module